MMTLLNNSSYHSTGSEGWTILKKGSQSDNKCNLNSQKKHLNVGVVMKSRYRCYLKYEFYFFTLMGWTG